MTCHITFVMFSGSHLKCLLLRCAFVTALAVSAEAGAVRPDRRSEGEGTGRGRNTMTLVMVAGAGARRRDIERDGRLCHGHYQSAGRFKSSVRYSRN